MKIVRHLQSFIHYNHLLWQLVVRDIKVRYRRSFLGIVWTVLNPLLTMGIMTMVFSQLFKSNIVNFPVYVLIGIVCFSFTSESTNQAMMSILNNAQLIKKVYIPKYLFPLSKVVSCLVNFGFSMVALFLVMIITKMPFYYTLPLLVVPLIYLFVFNMGIALILSAVNVYFRDIGHLYSVFVMAWMYLTPIFYSLDFVPDIVRRVIYLNPLYHYITFIRNLIMTGYFASLGDNLICLSVSLFFLLLGLLVFSRLQRNFILYI